MEIVLITLPDGSLVQLEAVTALSRAFVGWTLYLRDGVEILLTDEQAQALKEHLASYQGAHVVEDYNG